MAKMAFMGWMSWYGGSPVASSIAVAPRDQICRGEEKQTMNY